MTSYPASIKVVVADDHPVVLHGLVNLLRSEGGFEVVAACEDGAVALEAIRKRNPDVALLDLKLPRMTGLEILRLLAGEKLGARVVILTAFAEDRDVLAAVSHGVNGILMKESAPDVLIKCLHRVAAGDRWIPRELVSRALDRRIEAESIVNLLTVREREVILRIVEGLSNKQLALRLGLTEGTVKIHLHNIYAKTGVNSRAALLQLIQRLGADFTS
jgi:two-component system nitrate/nitrite response regulator NarL